MSAAAIFYGQFTGTQTPARVFTLTQRLARALGAIGPVLAGAWRGSVPGREARS
jgi:hypothetical protein